MTCYAQWRSPITGMTLCTAAAVLLTLVFQKSSISDFLPLLTLPIIVAVASSLGARAGLLGTIAATLIFATFLFEPKLSIRVEDVAQRGNLIWMLVGGVALSELLGHSAGSSSQPVDLERRIRPPFRSKQEVVIDAPLEAVWSFSMDLTKIPQFHPRVFRVDLLDGKRFREAGVSYQCHLLGGKHTCIEKDVEIVPLEKIVTVFPEDTLGLSKILRDYTVETNFRKLDNASTMVEICHYYSTTTLKAKFLSLIAKGKIARETQATLNSAKAAVDSALRQE